MSAPLSRDSVVDAARSMISGDGLDSLSLRRLAGHLGVTAPALYAHVEGKGDLLRAVADLGFTELIERYQALEELAAADPLQRLRALGRAYVEHALAEPEMFRLMFLFRPRELEAGEVDNVLQSATDAFELPLALVTEAIAQGALHPTREPLETALVLWTVAHGAASVLLLGIVMDPETRATLVDRVLDTTLDGLRSPPR